MLFFYFFEQVATTICFVNRRSWLLKCGRRPTGRGLPLSAEDHRLARVVTGNGAAGESLQNTCLCLWAPFVEVL